MDGIREHELLEKLYRLTRKVDSLHLLVERIFEREERTNLLLFDLLNPHRIERFVISQESLMVSIAPGNSPVFTATPVPATSVPSTPPTWFSSDTTNAPVSVDSTGLVATVQIPSGATVGASFTLTVSYTNADGTVATGSITETIVAPPSPDITSFTIAQTA